MSEWKLISTAPKDRPIEISGWPISYDEKSPEFVSRPTKWTRSLWFWGWWEGWNWRIPPSYWRELPMPPQRDESVPRPLPSVPFRKG